jgi:hypothetical protein
VQWESGTEGYPIYPAHTAFAVELARIGSAKKHGDEFPCTIAVAFAFSRMMNQGLPENE